ncbi:hypothetical protein HOF56_04885 [Candidatus Peribacteria bacterium]|jgi:mRNA-degrading endonuclease YafQ of YafQ-DinJ toxin-antitoxin module|nr:hypothetical protein [Candidatus Peribacteria bacterium]MBT4021474.1 hypothetical protein [Candidatus Peribacteria bacterium]MBT4240384.1 hypothetical protein [Candidatus Peribacteria bacterium]MBT4473807.1 hypothetical protein [Candidatus Peribacteria bacterium]
MFKLEFQPVFWKCYKQIAGKDNVLKKKIYKTLQTLSLNPRHPSLKTHKVITKKYGIKMSSWATGDIRIVWDFDKKAKLMILVLDIGKHSGKNKIYK